MLMVFGRCVPAQLGNKHAFLWQHKIEKFQFSCILIWELGIPVPVSEQLQCIQAKTRALTLNNQSYPSSEKNTQAKLHA